MNSAFFDWFKYNCLSTLLQVLYLSLSWLFYYICCNIFIVLPYQIWHLNIELKNVWLFLISLFVYHVLRCGEHLPFLNLFWKLADLYFYFSDFPWPWERNHFPWLVMVPGNPELLQRHFFLHFFIPEMCKNVLQSEVNKCTNLLLSLNYNNYYWFV